MTSLIDWATRTLNVIDQDGASVSRIVLITTHDGEVWTTWNAPFGSPDEWTASADGYLRSLENEWPNREVAVCFVAVTAQGETYSKYPRRVKGRNKLTPGGPFESSQGALSMAMDSLALTMEKCLRLVNTQLDTSRKALETNAITMHQQSELIKLMRHNAAMDQPEEPDSLGKLVAAHSGDFIDLAKLALTKWDPSQPPGKG